MNGRFLIPWQQSCGIRIKCRIPQLADRIFELSSPCALSLPRYSGERRFRDIAIRFVLEWVPVLTFGNCSGLCADHNRFPLAFSRQKFVRTGPSHPWRDTIEPGAGHRCSVPCGLLLVEGRILDRWIPQNCYRISLSVFCRPSCCRNPPSGVDGPSTYARLDSIELVFSVSHTFGRTRRKEISGGKAPFSFAQHEARIPIVPGKPIGNVSSIGAVHLDRTLHFQPIAFQ